MLAHTSASFDKFTDGNAVSRFASSSVLWIGPEFWFSRPLLSFARVATLFPARSSASALRCVAKRFCEISAFQLQSFVA